MAKTKEIFMWESHYMRIMYGEAIYVRILIWGCHDIKILVSLCSIDMGRPQAFSIWGGHGIRISDTTTWLINIIQIFSKKAFEI